VDVILIFQTKGDSQFIEQLHVLTKFCAVNTLMEEQQRWPKRTANLGLQHMKLSQTNAISVTKGYSDISGAVA